MSNDRQIHVFGDDNANVRTTPFANSNSPITRACNLPCVQGKLNKKLKMKKKQLWIIHLQLQMPLIISHM
jgi:hypothetical protein